MQSMYHQIGHIKNSNNAITGCKLKNIRTGQIQEIPVERLKANIKEFKRKNLKLRRRTENGKQKSNDTYNFRRVCEKKSVNSDLL